MSSIESNATGSPRGEPPNGLVVGLAALGLPLLAFVAGLSLLVPAQSLYLWAGASVLLLVYAALLYRHRRSLAALRARLLALPELGRKEEERAAGQPQRKAGRIDPLCAELEQTLEAIERDNLQRQSDLESLLGGSEAILTSLPDPVIAIDDQRRIVRANPAAEALFGRRVTGLELPFVVRAPALLAAVDAAIAGAHGAADSWAAPGRPQPTPPRAPGGGRGGGEDDRDGAENDRPNGIVEFSVPGKLERFFASRIVRLPRRTRDGTVVIITLQDLTAVRRADQMRADFVASVSHELRTPLASLLGFIETLRGPARDDEAARERFLSIMHEQAGQMSRLIEDLLSLSRIELEEHTPPTGQVVIDDLLQRVAGGLEPQASAKDMAIDIDLPDLPPVIGDEHALAQVFRNLIDNAIKYGRPGTAVRLSGKYLTPGSGGARRLARPGEAVKGVLIAVANKGEGIPREHLPRLTERFYRVDPARSRKLGGTGLGLAIVKHIVNRHRGVLEIESEPGEGTRCLVYLPSLGRTETPRAAQ